MPTFQTIRIHPDLHARLVTETTGVENNSTLNQHPAAADDNNNNNTTTTTTTTVSVIETPQALLSRHPASLRLWDPTTHTAKPISLGQIHQLRQEVALALLEHSQTGRTSRHVAAMQAVRVAAAANNNNKKRPRRRPPLDSAGAGTEHENDGHAMEEDNDATFALDQQQQGGKKPKMKMMTVPGTNTALDWLHYEQQQQQQLLLLHNSARRRRLALSTGCSALDRLVSVIPPSSSFSFGGIMMTTSGQRSSLLQQQQQQPYPNNNNNNTEDDDKDNIDDTTTTAAEQGIPFGYVTQLSGPSACGKTQLALQIVVVALSSSSAAAAASPSTVLLEQHDTAPPPPQQQQPAAAALAAATAETPVECWYLASCAADIRPCAKRLQQLLTASQQQQHHIHNNNNNNPDELLQHVHFCHVSNEYDVLRELTYLEEHLQQRQNNKCTLLILDSISISSCSSSSSSSSSSDQSNDLPLLHQIGMTIKRLTRVYRMATLVLNGAVQNIVRKNEPTASNIVNDDDDDDDVVLQQQPGQQQQQRLYKPALGRAWASIADIHVWLDHPHQNRLYSSYSNHHHSRSVVGDVVVHATLEKHPTRRVVVGDAAATVAFRITSAGIQGANVAY